jgi:hypothetical protein
VESSYFCYLGPHGTLGELLKLPPCSPKYGIVQFLFFLFESLYFCELGAHVKIRNPTTTTSGVLNNGIKKRKEKLPKIVVVCTSLGPKYGIYLSKPQPAKQRDGDGDY